MTNQKGRFGTHGGQYIPETLMNAVIELKQHMSITKMIRNLTGNSQNFSTNMQADLPDCIMQRR